MGLGEDIVDLCDQVLLDGLVAEERLHVFEPGAWKMVGGLLCGVHYFGALL